MLHIVQFHDHKTELPGLAGHLRAVAQHRIMNTG